MTSRRAFLKQVAAAATLPMVTGSGCAATTGGGPVSLLNHVGYTRHAHKTVVIAPAPAVAFQVVNAQSGVVALERVAAAAGADLGDWRVADLSAVTAPAQYQLRTGGHHSASFTISDDVYLPALRDTLGYFARQRCGHSNTGYNGACHLDDGVRKDDGQRLDVTGGWHDACDVRKWVNATIYGMIGLSRLLDSPAAERLGVREQIVDELRWGNRYFLAMQHPDGYVMSHCGGDDGNDWTDNKVGTADDRRIHTEPADVPSQYNFIAAQAAVARLMREIDPAYSQQCLRAAEQCLGWTLTNRTRGTARSMAAAVLALVAMDEYRLNASAETRAAGILRDLRSYQEKAEGEARGFFRSRSDSREPMREIMHGNLPLIALGRAIARWHGHADVRKWREMLTLHVDHLAALAGRNAFGIIPFGLYTDRGASPRRIGEYAYRYFMKPGQDANDSDWWVGINAHLASHGIGLLLASRVLSRPDLAGLAQRQLDWILGCNPFDASTITGHGHNHPPLYVPGHLKPPTPLLNGGVYNGIGGDANDNPDLKPKSWQTCEYWTPMVAYTMWLMAELS